MVIYDSIASQMADEWYVNGGYEYVIIGGILFLVGATIYAALTSKAKRWW